MAGSAATLAEISTVGRHKIVTVQDLRIAISVVTRRVNTASPASAPGEARVDLQTDVVIDTPDGTTWRVGSVSYQEDLAGVMVITAADPIRVDGDGWSPADAAELAELEAAFDHAGGRGVDLAERIDRLRAKRDGGGPAAPGVVLAGMVERLYDLNRDELRTLAWEALLISDGPDRVDGDVAPDHRIGVRLHGDEFIVAQQIDGDGRYPDGQ